MDDSLGPLDDHGVMRGDDKGNLPGLVERLQEFDQMFPGFGIKMSRN
ncbi:MAG: hypothetical protein Q8O04_04325 [Deltaproteobacteria bacterium]|nr:hypothetical protein [Deltaproteobacteria bacterium]